MVDNEDIRIHKTKVLIGEPRAMAKQRLMDFAASLPTTDYDWDGNEVNKGEVTFTELMERAAAYQESGEYWSEGGRFEGTHLYDGFWEDYALVSGQPVTDNYGFFSCSC